MTIPIDLDFVGPNPLRVLALQQAVTLTAASMLPGSDVSSDKVFDLAEQILGWFEVSVD